jgi:hypothetical protein
MDLFNELDLTDTWVAICNYYKEMQNSFSNDEYNLLVLIVFIIFGLYWFIEAIWQHSKVNRLEKQIANTRRIDAVCCQAAPMLGCSQSSCSKDCVELVVSAHIKLLEAYDNANTRHVRFMSNQLSQTLDYLEKRFKRYEDVILETDEDDDEDDDE